MTALRAHSDRYTSKPVDYRNYIDGASPAAGWPTRAARRPGSWSPSDPTNSSGRRTCWPR